MNGNTGKQFFKPFLRIGGGKILLGMALCLTLAIGFFDTSTYAASIRLNKKTATITVGKTLKLKVTGTKKKVKWSSSDSSVCTVSGSGTVKGKKAGTAKIRAKAGKKTLSCKVTVKAKPVTDKPTADKPVTATGLAIQAPYTKLAPGGTVQLSYSLSPSNAQPEAVEWESSNGGRASVSDSGLVTAKGTGDVTITAWLKSNEDVSAKITLTIEELTVEASVKTENGGDLLLSDPSSKAVYTGTVSYIVPDARVEVVDGLGKVIRTYPQGAKDPQTPISVTWDLKDASGSLVSPGSYCFQLVAVGAAVKSAAFTIYAGSEFGGGNGSVASPYLISTVDELKLVWKHNGVNFKQTQDIDLGIKPMNPMFTTDVPFTGTYDGGGFKIAGINNITEKENQALFSGIGETGTVKNLTVADGIFKGTNRLAVIAAVNYGTIENCTVTGCQIVTTNGAAGIISCDNYGTIKNCQTGKNNASIVGKSCHAGSMSAWNKGTILNCTSGTGEKDSISIHGTSWYGEYGSGGIAGRNEGSVISCTVISVELNGVGTYTAGDSVFIGGIAGWNFSTVSSCTVESCTITGDHCAKGGIIGRNSDGINTNNNCGSSEYPQVGWE